MINDELTWNLIGNKSQCSFKVKLPQGQQQRFCRNQYNITGLCNRGSCPLANSQYATVLERDGLCYLYMKTAERAHTPNRMWERVKLSSNYMEALEQIDVQLAFWPRPMKHKIKQRFTKIKQYLLRMRRLKLKETTELVTVNSKVERRELKREKKAEIAARIDNKIKAELLERLSRGLYADDILNIEHGFSEILDENEELENEEEEQENEQEYEREEVDEYIEDIDDLEDLGNEDFDDSFFDEDDEEGPEDDNEDDEEEEPKEQPKPISRVPTTKKRGPAFMNKGARKHVKMMYETETERDTQKDKDIDY